MMNNDIIEKVRKTVSKTAKKAARVSGDAIDFTKLKLKLFEIKDKLDDNYAKIGMLVYEGKDSDELEKICDEITTLRDEEAEIKLKLDAFGSKRTCPVCGEKVDTKSQFCQHCGSRME